jgi:hypothetical protein
MAKQQKKVVRKKRRDRKNVVKGRLISRQPSITPS